MCGKGKKEMTEEQNKNKWNNNATLFIPLEKVDSINFHPKIELIEGMTPDETWSCLFTDVMFGNLVEQTQFYAIRDKRNHLSSNKIRGISVYWYSSLVRVPQST